MADFYCPAPGSSLEPLQRHCYSDYNPTKVGCYLSFGSFCTSHIYSSFCVFHDRLSPPLNIHTLISSALQPFEALPRLSGRSIPRLRLAE
jgi:hypothetical protein